MRPSASVSARRSNAVKRTTLEELRAVALAYLAHGSFGEIFEELIFENFYKSLAIIKQHHR